MKNIKKVLIFSPHPDDSDFGCGGTIAKMTAQGKRIVLCIITDGSKGVHWSRFSPKEIVPVRKREQKAAAAVLGIKKVLFLGEEDGKLENTSKLRRKLVKIIRQEKPDAVFSFDPGNKQFDRPPLFHRDHRVAAEAVFDSVYPEAGCNVFYPDLAKKGWQQHSVKAMYCFGTDKPNYWADISSAIGKKKRALFAHKSQFRDFRKIEDLVSKLAREAGINKKIKYAEAFRRIVF